MLVGFRARNHFQQIDSRGVLDAVDDRGTDPVFFARMESRFGPFTLDVAASDRNAKCENYYTINDNGLKRPWGGHRVWCNPPYSGLDLWVRKATICSPFCPIIVMLLPNNRCEQAWWQDWIEPFRDRPRSSLSVEFLRSRLRFIQSGQEEIGPNERPPFGSVLAIWNGGIGDGR